MPLVQVQEPAGIDRAGLQAWFFAHHQDHIEIVQALQKLGKKMVIYPLDPFTPHNPGKWLQLHQAAHNDMNQALGNSGEDLQDVNFDDPKSLSAFFYQNFQEHQAARSDLNI